MNQLKANLENKSAVLKSLSNHMLISNIIIVNNDPINKNNKVINDIAGIGCNKIQSLIDQSNKLKNELLSLKDFFDSSFLKIRKENKNLELNDEEYKVTGNSKLI